MYSFTASWDSVYEHMGATAPQIMFTQTKKKDCCNFHKDSLPQMS